MRPHALTAPCYLILSFPVLSCLIPSYNPLLYSHPLFLIFSLPLPPIPSSSLSPIPPSHLAPLSTPHPSLIPPSPIPPTPILPPHRHPVYSMSMSGLGSALELVTASTDGTLCQWDISRLTEPTNTSTLISPASSTQVLCRTFPC